MFMGGRGNEGKGRPDLAPLPREHTTVSATTISEPKKEDHFWRAGKGFGGLLMAKKPNPNCIDIGRAGVITGESSGSGGEGLGKSVPPGNPKWRRVASWLAAHTVQNSQNSPGEQQLR